MRSTSGLSLVVLAPAALLWATPSQAFDCSKASTEIEHIICGDPDARASDDAMAAAYSALAAQLDAKGKQELLSSQRHWLAYRNDACQGADAACVISMSDARRAQLTATPERSGPGAPSFIPKLYWRAGTPKTYEVSIGYPQVKGPATAATTALNQALEAAAMADRDTFLAELGPDDSVPTGQMTYELTYTIAYAGADFVSVVYDIYAYGGGAHPNAWTSAVNFLLDEGRPLAFEDMFDATGAAALRKVCRKQIADTKAANGVPADMIADDLTDDALDAVLQDPTKWVFAEPGLVINFDPYAIGAYAEGPYICTIDATLLAKIARAGAPGLP